jgi:SnoaL-like domain
MELSEVVHSLQELSDIEYIRHLKHRYFRFLDTRDWDALRALFTNNAVFDIEGIGVVGGPEEFIDIMKERNQRARSIHHGHNSEITHTGRDKARGIWVMYDYVDRIKPTGEREAYQGYGYYDETYERSEDDVWLMASMKLRRIRLDPRQPIGPPPTVSGGCASRV